MAQRTTTDEHAARGEDETAVAFSVPTWVLTGRHMSATAFAAWLRKAAALFSYSRGEITLGTAAAIAGMSQAEFMHVAKGEGLPTVDEDLEALNQELAYLAQRRGQSEASG